MDTVSSLVAPRCSFVLVCGQKTLSSFNKEFKRSQNRQKEVQMPSGQSGSLTLFINVITVLKRTGKCIFIVANDNLCPY